MSSSKLYNPSSNFGFSLNAQANIIDILPTDVKPFGYSHKFFIGKPFTDFLTPPYSSQFIKYSKKAVINKAFNCECEFTHKNHKKVWYKVSIVCKIERGKKNYFGYCNNIDELKVKLIESQKTIQALKTANAVNYETIHAAEAIILRLDPDATIISISKGAEKILGYKLQELVSKNWFRSIVPASKFPQYQQGFNDFIKSKKLIRTIIAPIISKGGIQKNISWKTSKIILDGKVIGTIAIGKDVTGITQKVKQLEESEKRFKSLAEQMLHPIALVTKEGKFAFLNKAFTRQFGYNLKNFTDINHIILDNKLDEKLERDDTINLQNEVAQVFESQKPIFNKIEIQTKAGEIRQVEYTASLSNGFVCYVYTDITDRKAKEDLLIKTSETFKQIATNTPIAIAGCNISNSKVTFANKYFIKLFGYTIKEINLMEDWGDLIVYENEIHKIQSLALWQQIKEKIQANPTAVMQKTERRIRCKNGMVKDIEVGITYNAGVLYALFYDITERKENERKLKGNEKKFRKLAELVPTPISFISTTGEIMFFNKAYIQQFGFTVKDVLNVNDLIIKTYGNIIERQEALNCWKRDLELLNNGKQIQSRQQVLYTKKGEKKIIEYSAVLSGNYIYYTYLDITERVEHALKLLNEAEVFKQITENTPIAVAGCNLKTLTVTYLNKEFYKTFGYVKKDIQHFNDWFAILVSDTPEESERNNKEWQIILSNFTEDTQDGIKLIERNILCKNGKIKTCQIGFNLKDGIIYGFFFDITDRKQTERKLIESEERFRNLAELLPTPISCKTIDDKIVFLNQAYIQQLGYTLNDIPDFKHWLQRAYQKSSERKAAYALWKQDVSSLMKGEKTPVRILEVYNKFGKKRILSHTTTISGNSIYCAYSDITEQIEFEKKIAASEERFRNIVENLPIPLVSLNPVTGVLFANKKHQTLLGHNNSSSSSTTDFSTFSIDDMPNEFSRKQFIKLVQKVKNNKSDAQITEPNYTAQIVCKDQSLRTFEITESIFGNTLYTLFHDITEQLKANELLKESEQKFKALAENMPIAIGAYDANGNTIFVNKHFTDTTGYSIKDVPTILDWYINTQPNATRRLEFYNFWTKTIDSFRKGKLNSKPEIKASSLCKNGSFKYFAYSFSIFGDTTYILLIDITEEERAKKALEKSHQELRNLASHLQNIREEERKNISREIHDELGQQLTGIKMDVSAISKRIASTDVSISSSFKQILEMLNLSVKTVRKISTQLRPSILDDLGLSAAMEWQLNDFGKRANVICTFRNDLNILSLQTNIESNLFRILQESLTNVARHAAAKNVLIDLSNDDKQIYLSISDDGKGFNKNLPASTLGLLGMKERALMLNGNFEVNSKKGKGTLIKISVPIKS